MAIEFAGFVYTNAGVAVASATVELYDRNTTTPVRATTTTDANGYWSISHATEGRFDVKITNGSSIRWIKYDHSRQFEEVETSVLKVRNGSNTFTYNIAPAAITASYVLTLPLLTTNSTLSTVDGVPRSTQSQLEAETSTNTYVSPDLVRHSPGVAKAWVTWEQTGSHSVVGSYNWTSVTDAGAAGDTDHVFGVTFSTTTWCAVTCGETDTSIGIDPNTKGQTSVSTLTVSISGTGSQADINNNMMAIFGDL